MQHAQPMLNMCEDSDAAGVASDSENLSSVAPAAGDSDATDGFFKDSGRRPFPVAGIIPPE